MRRLVIVLGSLAATLVIVGSAFAASGPPALAFYVDGHRYRTVGTPTDLFGTGAPSSSYDRIYALGDGLINVAEAKPGDRDYSGGRWLVLPLTWNVAPIQLTTAEQVEMYADQGWLTIGEPVKSFVCPVIPVGGRS